MTCQHTHTHTHTHVYSRTRTHAPVLLLCPVLMYCADGGESRGVDLKFSVQEHGHSVRSACGSLVAALEQSNFGMSAVQTFHPKRFASDVDTILNSTGVEKRILDTFQKMAEARRKQKEGQKQEQQEQQEQEKKKQGQEQETEEGQQGQGQPPAQAAEQQEHTASAICHAIIEWLAAEAEIFVYVLAQDEEDDVVFSPTEGQSHTRVCPPTKTVFLATLTHKRADEAPWFHAVEIGASALLPCALAFVCFAFAWGKTPCCLSRHAHTRSLTHSHTHTYTHMLSHSLTHSLSHSLTRSLTLSLTRSLTLALARSLSHTLTHSHTHSLTHSLTHPHLPFCPMGRGQAVPQALAKRQAARPAHPSPGQRRCRLLELHHLLTYGFTPLLFSHAQTQAHTNALLCFIDQCHPSLLSTCFWCPLQRTHCCNWGLSFLYGTFTETALWKTRRCVVFYPSPKPLCALLILFLFSLTPPLISVSAAPTTAQCLGCALSAGCRVQIG